MAKFNTADIIALHNAGIPDELIDKLVDSATPAPAGKKDPMQKEQPEEPTATEILQNLLNPPDNK